MTNSKISEWNILTNSIIKSLIETLPDITEKDYMKFGNRLNAQVEMILSTMERQDHVLAELAREMAQRLPEDINVGMMFADWLSRFDAATKQESQL